MNELLEQIEQCLYEFKHNSNQPLKHEVKEAIREVEIALQQLIHIVESQGVNSDSSRNPTTR